MHQTARAQLGASQPFRGVAAPELAARRQRHPLPLLERCRSALFAERKRWDDEASAWLLAGERA